MLPDSSTNSINVVPDSLSRPSDVAAAISGHDSLKSIHDLLGHPGIRRLNHFVKKNLPFSLDDVKSTCRECKICAESKPQFYKQAGETVVNATPPWERIAVDVEGPLKGKLSHVLVVIEEFSRFPYAFPCRDISAKTVIQGSPQLCCLFGMPGYVHSDRGSAFMSSELREFLLSRNVATSRATSVSP